MKYFKDRAQTLNEDSGFTLIELLIATTVFTLMLVVITVSVISISNNFYKGITIANTQTTARNIVNNLTQSIQDNGGGIVPISSITDPVTHITTAGFCIGTISRYSYLFGYEVKQGVSTANSTTLQAPYGLVEDNMGGTCTSSTNAQNLGATAPALTATSRELLGANTRLVNFPTPSLVGTSCLTTSDQCLYKVSAKVIYGDTDQLSPGAPGPNTVCNLQAGAQFCAFSSLTTFVQKRVQ
jgi:prepilin-type N-terminal cleavage/methylation domain-containing protein